MAMLMTSVMRPLKLRHEPGVAFLSLSPFACALLNMASGLEEKNTSLFINCIMHIKHIKHIKHINNIKHINHINHINHISHMNNINYIIVINDIMLC